MALIHLFTLGSFIFGPIFIIYKSTKTATKTTNIYSNLVYGFIAYSMTLFFKMLFVATIVSSSSSSSSSSSNQQQQSLTMSSVVPDVTTSTTSGTTHILFEFLKAILNLSDFLALFLVFNRLKLFGGDDSKVVGVGLGWALAENIWSRSVPLYVWTIRHGMEFDWSWVRSGIHANISLFLYLSLAASVFLFARFDKSSSVDSGRRVFAGVLSLLLIILPIISQLINMVVAAAVTMDDQMSSSSTALVIHGTLTVILSLVSFKMFNSYVTRSTSTPSSIDNKRGGK